MLGVTYVRPSHHFFYNIIAKWISNLTLSFIYVEKATNMFSKNYKFNEQNINAFLLVRQFVDDILYRVTHFFHCFSCSPITLCHMFAHHIIFIISIFLAILIQSLFFFFLQYFFSIKFNILIHKIILLYCFLNLKEKKW